MKLIFMARGETPQIQHSNLTWDQPQRDDTCSPKLSIHTRSHGSWN